MVSFIKIIIYVLYDYLVSLCMDNMIYFLEIEKFKEFFMLYNLYDEWVILVGRAMLVYSRILNI